MMNRSTERITPRQGVAVAGYLVVDQLYPIAGYPANGEVCTLLDDARLSPGGAACNVSLDLARLAPGLPVHVLGVTGDDPNGAYLRAQLSAEPGMDLSDLRTAGRTAYTFVMQDERARQRTFFAYRGANALFGEDCIDWDALDARLLHVGYALLLDRLDAPDEECGTKMARLLCRAQRLGIATSLDVVSEGGARMARLLPPALRYTNYFIINEFEAQQITGIALTRGDRVIPEKADEALRALRGMGVAEWAVIHSPECCFGMGRDGRMLVQPSLLLPPDFIQGTVGAGDAFCSGVLLGAYRGWTLAEAMKLGVCAAACALSAPNSSDGLRPAEEALSLLNSYGVRS